MSTEDTSREHLLQKLQELQRENARLTQSIGHLHGMTEEAGDLFAELVRSVNTCMWVFDPHENRFCFMSPAYERIWNRPVADLYSGRTGLLDSVHPEDRERVQQQMTAAMQGHAFDLTWRIVRPDNGVRWIWGRGLPRKRNDGTLERMYGVADDITAQSLAQEQLRQREHDLHIRDRITDIFLGTSDATLYDELLLFILEVCESPYGYFGFIDENGDLVCPTMTRDVWEMCSVPAKDYVFPRAGWGGLWGDSLREKTTKLANQELSPPPGHIPVTAALVVPIVHHGTLIGQVAVANKADGYDDDDRARLEMICDYIAPVLHAMRQRQHEIEERLKVEQQYRHAQKMEAIGTLAGGIAHDFNNILGAIMGYAEMACEDAPQNSTLKEDLNEILRSSERARDLVQQILLFSRRGQHERIALNPYPLVKEVAKMLQASAPATIDFTYSLDPSTGNVYADPSQIQQIVMNLGANAIEAMNESGGSLTITMRGVSIDEPRLAGYHDITPGPHIQISVCDTGCGMDSDTVDRIFEPFFTKQNPAEASGMGLAVVHGIARSLGGDVAVESTPGRGSTFTVVLPQHIDETPAAPQDADEVCGGTEHILFVDDEQALRTVGRRMLESLGYRVDVMESSAAACDAVTADPQKYDLVITDQTMPGMTGFALAGKLLAARPDIPVILCTGYSDTVNPEAAAAAGIRGFVRKPASRQVLAAAIRRALDRRQ